MLLFYYPPFTLHLCSTQKMPVFVSKIVMILHNLRTSQKNGAFGILIRSTLQSNGFQFVFVPSNSKLRQTLHLKQNQGKKIYIKD